MESDSSMLILPDYRSFLSLPTQLKVHMATGSLLLLCLDMVLIWFTSSNLL
jgi:hypothetical protein